MCGKAFVFVEMTWLAFASDFVLMVISSPIASVGAIVRDWYEGATTACVTRVGSVVFLVAGIVGFVVVVRFVVVVGGGDRVVVVFAGGGFGRSVGLVVVVAAVVVVLMVVLEVVVVVEVVRIVVV